jgi:hypothetical protein
MDQDTIDWVEFAKVFEKWEGFSPARGDAGHLRLFQYFKLGFRGRLPRDDPGERYREALKKIDDILIEAAIKAKN